MPGLHLYRSNRVEALAEALAQLLREPLADPLQAETIVVQSLGMRRWLSFQLAERLGIAMNGDFPFFAEFAQAVFRGAFPEAKGGVAFGRAALPWRVLAALPKFLGETEFAPLRRYIGDDEASELKRFHLARQIATVFDRYMVYAPEQLAAWEAGAREGWQTVLWRQLTSEVAEPPPPEWLRRLRDFSGPLAKMPERVSIFGVASLPPYYLELLSLVARRLEVHLFLFEPTEFYWGDTMTPAEQRRFLRRHGRPGQTAEDLHLESGNELLVTLGKAGRAFNRAVQDLQPVSDPDLFETPGDTTLLERLQADIFSWQEEPISAALLADGTLQFHCCHGPMRELEVLHDQLLALFERYPDLTPKEILVAMPNVETHAPFIEAVFGAPESDAVRIPYSIADRSVRARSNVAATLRLILDLQGSRFSAARVLEVLEARAVRDRFGMVESDLATVRSWVDQTSIRWGIDAEHRRDFDLPAFEQNSWRAGLDRLVLGYALRTDEPRLFGTIVPESQIEGGWAGLLGQFTDFAEKLFAEVRSLAEPRGLVAWSQTLGRLLELFFDAEGGDAEEVLAARKAVAGLAALAPFHPGAIAFPILRAHVETLLNEAEGGSGFLAGRVTFCSLMPMRSIPFRAICLLGMNDTAFPRRETPIAFDLLGPKAKASGRSRRDEDRQLFLESLLSAREVFYVSYVGQSDRTNAESPPSTVVSGLLDYVTARTADPEAARKALVVKHRLQPFATTYFEKGSPLFSYSRENAEVSQVRRTPVRREEAPERLPELEPEWRQVELARLLEFFGKPPKFFVRRRLRAILPEEQGSPDDCEPMVLDGLARWKLSQDFLASTRRGVAMEERVRLAQATGVLPGGHFGRAEATALAAEIEPMLALIEQAGLGEPRPPALVAGTLGPWELSGSIEQLHEGGLLHVMGWKAHPRDRLRAWISHLALHLSEFPGPRVTVLITQDVTVRFGLVPEAEDHLRGLLDLYEQGLRAPLPLFLKSSFAYAQCALGAQASERDDAVERAVAKFEAEEMADPHQRLCFRQRASPYDEEWRRVAEAVFHPLLKAEVRA